MRGSLALCLNSLTGCRAELLRVTGVLPSMVMNYVAAAFELLLLILLVISTLS